MKFGCVILAGGKSSRMGTDKALLEINNQKFIEYISEELSHFEEKIIARGNCSKIPGINWNVIEDEYPECGPISGLHAALSACDSDALFCVACDMPFIKSTLAKRLCDLMQDQYDAIVVQDAKGKIHPLCGVYRKTVVRILEQQILAGNNRIMAALEKMNVLHIKINLEEEIQQLKNINTPEEFQTITKIQ